MVKKFIKKGWVLFTNPDEAFHFIKAEHITNNFLLRYVAIMAFFTLIGHIIRESVFGIIVSDYGKVKIPFAYSIIGNIVYLVLILAMAYFLSAIICIFAKHFNSVKSRNKALKLVAYVLTPALLVGILYFVPIVGEILFIASFAYGIYLLHRGFPVLMETTKDRVLMFTLLVTICWIILHLIIWVIAQVFVKAPYL